jgi:hypothetical protein
MRLLKFVVPAVILIGGFTLSTVNSYGKAAYVKTTKKQCVTCHTAKPPAKDGKDLTAVGKCYKDSNKDEAKRTLDGCAAKK